MKITKYSSYAEIDRELEILKLEKEINYQKLALSFEKTKESITPQNIVNDFVGSYVNSASLPFGDLIPKALPFILKTALPLLIKWISNKKRGD